MTLAALMALVVGCSGAAGPGQAPVPAPAPAPAPDVAPPPLGAPQTDAERYRRYEQLKNNTAGIPYVYMWDNDERIDKLVIGLGTLEAKQAVQREMAKLGLPEESVVIEHPKLLLSEAAPFAGCQAAAPKAEAVGLKIPAVMKPGQEFDLTVKLDGQITRGVNSYLECWDGTAWSPRFSLFVGTNGPDAKPSARVGTGGVVITLGLAGPGPERLVLPAAMPPGWYRIRKEVSVGQTQQTVTALFEVRP